MSFTPVFDSAVQAADADLWKASPIFPQPSTHWSLAADRLWAPTNPRYRAKVTGEFPKVEAVNDPTGRVAWKVTGEFPKPEPKWRTFLRCLFWWMP